MKISKIVIATLLLALVSAPAFAARSRMSYDRYDSSQQASTYIGISGGKTSLDITDFTATGTAMSVFVGYQFNRYMSTELAYTNMGTLDQVISGYDTSTKISASSLNVLGYLPMGKVVSLYGKVGYASTSTTVDVGTTAGTPNTLAGVTVGAGVQFNLGRNANIRVSYDTYKISGDGTATNTASIPSVGVMFRF